MNNKNSTTYFLLPGFQWIVLFNIITLPVAYFAMPMAPIFRLINISWLTFLLADELALIITLLTVSWQAIRAATVNPVEALRYE